MPAKSKHEWRAWFWLCGCLFLIPLIAWVLEKWKKTLPGAQLGAFHPPFLKRKKINHTESEFTPELTKSRMSLSKVLLKQNQTTQSLGQDNRENCTVETMNFLAFWCWATGLLYIYVYVCECVYIGMSYIWHRQPEGYSYCTHTEQKCNSFTPSSKRNVLLCLLGPSSMFSDSALLVNLKQES